MEVNKKTGGLSVVIGQFTVECILCFYLLGYSSINKLTQPVQMNAASLKKVCNYYAI